MSEEWVSLSSVARDLEIAESTARRWASMFGDFLQSKGHGAGRRFHPSTRDVLRRVQDLYAKNLTAEQIADQLSREFSMLVDVQAQDEQLPAVPTVAPEEMMRMMAEMVAERVSTELNTMRDKMAGELTALRDELAATKNDNEELRSLIDERLSASERAAMERGRKLDEALRLLNERNQEQGKRGFWQRLTGK